MKYAKVGTNIATITITIIIVEITLCVFLLLKLNILSPQSTERILYMNFSVFASFMIFVVFLIWLGYEIKKHSRYDEKKQAEYWAREQKANSTRKQSLDNHNYISIPVETFPTKIMTDDDIIKEYIETLDHLLEEKIVNLTGITNTDLKLEYGAANLPVLIHYDQCYTLLVRTLQAWAMRLYENGYESDCLPLLEFAVETGTDISGTYKLLAKIYVKNGNKEKLDSLKSKTETLNSAMKKPIDRMLKEFDL